VTGVAGRTFASLKILAVASGTVLEGQVITRFMADSAEAGGMPLGKVTTGGKAGQYEKGDQQDFEFHHEVLFLKVGLDKKGLFAGNVF